MIMLRRIVMFVLIIIAYLLQTTLFRAVSIAGIVPNILIYHRFKVKCAGIKYE